VGSNQPFLPEESLGKERVVKVPPGAFSILLTKGSFEIVLL